MEEIIIDSPHCNSPEIIEVNRMHRTEKVNEPLLYEVDEDIMQIDRDLQAEPLQFRSQENSLKNCMLLTIDDESESSNSATCLDKVKFEDGGSNGSTLEKDTRNIILETIDMDSKDSKEFDECPIKREKFCNCVTKKEPLSPVAPKPEPETPSKNKHPRISLNFPGGSSTNLPTTPGCKKTYPKKFGNGKKSNVGGQKSNGEKAENEAKSDENKKRDTYCKLCSVNMVLDEEYASHMAGKKHSKMMKDWNRDNDYYANSISVTGFARENPQAALRLFVNYGIKSVEICEGVMYLQFYSRDTAVKIKQKQLYVNGNKLRFFPVIRKPNKEQTGSQNQKNNARHNHPKEKEVEDLPPISKFLFNQMMRPQNEGATDVCLMTMMNEIQLQPNDLRQRERIRLTMAQFLNTIFPAVNTFVFGSSANNLGFVGCDLDLYADLGFDPWATGQFNEKVARAADLTKFLAKELRKSKMGYNVIPIARARVPIVKFTDPYSRVNVDLSFKHMMPIHNTRLINTFTIAHPAVRPFMFSLRYWAKIHNVAKGANPSTHFTNYCFTQMMAFYLMVRRKGAILPTVQELKFSYVPVIVDGWDCGFNSNVNAWANKYHDISLVELLMEFFDFYGNFNFDEAVVCPLLGEILSRREFASQSLNVLPRVYMKYCSGSKPLELKTAFCLQDPFEHSHNVARGLSEYYFAVFQYKCRKSFEVLQAVRRGGTAIGMLYERIHVIAKELPFRKKQPPQSNEANDVSDKPLSDLRELFKDQDVVELDKDSEEKVDEEKVDEEKVDEEAEVEKVEEVNIIDDSDSQNDESEGVKINENSTSNDDRPDIIIDEESLVRVEDSSEIENQVAEDSEVIVEEDTVVDGEVEAGVDDEILICDESPVKICGFSYNPEKEFYNFTLDLSFIQSLEVEDGGQISLKDIDDDSTTLGKFKGVQAKDLIRFIFKRILLIESETIMKESSTHILAFLNEEKKRKNSCSDCGGINKKLKNNNGEAVDVVVNNFDLLIELECETSLAMWVGRRKTSRMVKISKNDTPLQWEILVSEKHASQLVKMEEPTQFATAIWQDKSNPNSILLTFKNPAGDHCKHFAPMISYITYLTKNLLTRLGNYVSAIKGY